MNQGQAPDVGARSHPGLQRSSNQDSLALPAPDLPAEVLARKGYLYVVADGMGGHRSGGRASSIAASTTMERYYADASPDASAVLVRAIKAANAVVYQQGQLPELTGMGTTVVAAVIASDQLIVAHVGDSRAYLVRPGAVQRLTEDHTWATYMVDEGMLSPQDADHHPQRHRLSRSVGPRPEVQVDVRKVRLAPGDQVLLCSDGLSGVVEDAEIHAVLSNMAPDAAAERLVEMANARGGPDNISVIAIVPKLAPGSVAGQSSRPVAQASMEERAATWAEGIAGEQFANLVRRPWFQALAVAVVVVVAVLAIAGCVVLGSRLGRVDRESTKVVPTHPVGAEDGPQETAVSDGHGTAWTPDPQAQTSGTPEQPSAEFTDTPTTTLTATSVPTATAPAWIEGTVYGVGDYGDPLPRGLVVRDQPWPKPPVVGSLFDGDKVKVHCKAEAWYNISSGELKGYVKSEFIRLADEMSPKDVVPCVR